MMLRDWWRIQTPYGYVELELAEAGASPVSETELAEAENVLDVLTYGVENRDPRITNALLEAYAQSHPESFAPGLALSSLSVRDIDPMRPLLIRYLQHQVAAGTIRLYEDDVVATTIDVLEPLKYVPQPVVPEKATFVGVRLVDQDGEPVTNSRIRIRLPDGDIWSGRTNDAGEVMLKELSLAGIAEVTLLDFPDAEPTDGAEDFDDVFRLIDEVSGDPLVDHAYRLETESGLVVEGRTDGSGLTQKLRSRLQEEVTISMISEAISVSARDDSSEMYDDRFQLVDDVTGEPLADRGYRLETESGVVVDGRTDGD
ncbi:MAG: hypothetical protein ACM3ZE_21505, partial [Myxococcales bacterium]